MDDGLLALVEQILAAPVEGGWPAALGALAGRLGAQSVELTRLGPDGVPTLRVHVGADEAREADPARDAARLRALRAHGAEAVRLESLRAPDDAPAPERGGFVPAGFAHGAAVLLEDAGAGTDVLAVLRTDGQGPCSDEQLETLARLRPALRRALALEDRLRAVEARRLVAEGLLESLHVAAALVDAAGHLRWANRRFRETATRGALLRLEDERLVAVGEAAAKRLQESLRAAAGAAGAAVGDSLRLEGSRREGEWLAVTLWPLPASSAGSGGPGLVLVLLAEPALRRPLSAQVAAELFGLTPSEAAVAVGLAEGLEVRDVAAQRGVSVETVRTQLKAAMAKLGVTRQAELVRLLVSGPVSWPDPRRAGGTRPGGAR